MLGRTLVERSRMLELERERERERKQVVRTNKKQGHIVSIVTKTKSVMVTIDLPCSVV